MDKFTDNFLENMKEKGLIDLIRKEIISVLINIEEFDSTLLIRGELSSFIKNIEDFLYEILNVQKIADGIILNLSDEQKRDICRKIPELFDLFGWKDTK